jgi:hypothetical protein
LDGLNVVALGYFDGNIWEGKTKATMGMYLDERADERQREALMTIFSGQRGGWPRGVREHDRRGSRDGVRTDHVRDRDDLAYCAAEVPGKATARAEALTGPTTPEGKRVQVHNPPGAEVGPGQVATWGKATTDHVDGFGFKWEWDGRSSKHFTFDWQGP